MYNSNNFKHLNMAILSYGQVGWRSSAVAAPAGCGYADTDVCNFITAASITDSTQQTAINTLVTQLKTYGIWSKMKAIYPFVGGSASSHKFNLKDPRDLDAAYRLVFNGGWTHSSTGAKPDGTTGYANTFLNGSLRLTLNNTHLSYYSRTSNSGTPGRTEIGSQTSSTNIISIAIYSYGGIFATCMNDTTTSLSNGNNTRSDGFYVGSRINSNSVKTYFRNSLINTNTATNIGTLPNDNIYIGCNGSSTTSRYEFSDRESAFASIGDGLTDTESANFYTAVQAYQTTLGRQI